jgi:hypothetical protein
LEIGLMSAKYFVKVPWAVVRRTSAAEAALVREVYGTAEAVPLRSVAFDLWSSIWVFDLWSSIRDLVCCEFVCWFVFWVG